MTDELKHPKIYFFLVCLTLYGKAGIAGRKKLLYQEGILLCYVLCFAKVLSSWGCRYALCKQVVKKIQYCSIVYNCMLMVSRKLRGEGGNRRLAIINVLGQKQNIISLYILGNPVLSLRSNVRLIPLRELQDHTN